MPFGDANVNITINNGKVFVDAIEFYLIFGNSSLKLTSCASTLFGVCAGTEADPASNINKYLPNDQYWIGGGCVSCPAGWSGLNGKCFQRFGSNFTYGAAQVDCQSKNASLAMLNTNAKFNLVKSLIPYNSSLIVNIKLFF